jgi:hypothetical protein
MASSDGNRSGLLIAGGVLSIVSGVSEAAFGAITVGSTIAHMELLKLWPPSVFPDTTWWIGMGASIFALGIVAIVGGVSAIRRSIFGLSLAGAICCQVSSAIYGVLSFFGVASGGAVWALAWLILGLLAIIFVSLSKREFRGERASRT